MQYPNDFVTTSDTARDITHVCWMIHTINRCYTFIKNTTTIYTVGVDIDQYSHAEKSSYIATIRGQWITLTVSYVHQKYITIITYTFETHKRAQRTLQTLWLWRCACALLLHNNVQWYTHTHTSYIKHTHKHIQLTRESERASETTVEATRVTCLTCTHAQR